MPLRTVLFSLAASLSALSVAMPIAGSSTAHASEDLRLESFFLDDLDAEGHFKSWIAGVDRRFTVKARGSMKDGVLTLVEDFYFEDGEQDQKTWRFTKVGPNRYEGTREDVVGKAIIVERGGRIYMSYLIDLPGEGDPTRVRFKDVLYYGEDGDVINKARVSKFGLPIANVEVIFSK